MLGALMDKVDNMQGPLHNVSRKVEILRTANLKIKNTATETKNASHELIRRLETAELRISELEHLLLESSKTEKQKEHRLKTRVSGDCGMITKDMTYVIGILGEKKGTEEIC